MSNINLLPLESIDGFIWMNGNFIKWQDAKLHVLTHSLHYGGAVFEGEKAYNGKIFKINEHTERFYQSANLMKLSIPYEKSDIINASYELLNKNNLKNAYIRPLAWRSTEALMLRPSAPVTNLMIAAWEPRAKKSNEPFNICVSKWRKPSDNTCYPQCKTSSNYSMLFISISEAIEKGYKDAILLDQFGNISECTTSNIFFIKQNILYTPKATSCLNGITRQTVLQIAENLGIQKLEQDIAQQDIATFESAFITGTACGLKLIDSIECDSRIIPLSNNTIFQQLKSQYQNLTGEIINE